MLFFWIEPGLREIYSGNEANHKLLSSPTVSVVIVFKLIY